MCHNNYPADTASNVTSDTLEVLLSPVMTVGVPTVYLLVFVCSTPFNLLSLVTMLLIHCRKSHNPTSVFAINLSLAHLLYNVFLPLQVLYHRQGNDWHWGAVCCGVATTLLYCNMHCSALTTCAIALERYCGVVHPLHTRHWRSARRATAVCVLIWALVLVVQTPLLRSDLTLRVRELNITTCFDIVPRKVFEYGGVIRPRLGYLYFATSLVLFYLIPFIVLVCAYIAVARGLRRSSKETTDDSERQALSSRRALIAIALATVCFVVCHLPTILIEMLHIVFSSMGDKSLYSYYKLALAINGLNGCFDPFVYYFASREFRRTLREALNRCWSCCSPLQDSGARNWSS